MLHDQQVTPASTVESLFNQVLGNHASLQINNILVRTNEKPLSNDESRFYGGPGVCQLGLANYITKRTKTFEYFEHQMPLKESSLKKYRQCERLTFIASKKPFYFDDLQYGISVVHGPSSLCAVALIFFPSGP